MYKVDVTVFRQLESEKGFPITEDDETRAWDLFNRTIAGLYSNPNITGSYTVILYAVGKGGEVPLRTQLVNVPRN
jgi:hypothetical protein